MHSATIRVEQIELFGISFIAAEPYFNNKLNFANHGGIGAIRNSFTMIAAIERLDSAHQL